MALSRSQTRYLRGLAHALKPVILVGQKGVTPGLIEELSNALDHHELIKVKISAEDRDARAAVIEALTAGSKGEVVQKIGNVLCLYRRNKEETKIELPR